MEISTYAVVENSIVMNIILWDGGDEWAPPSGSIAVLIPADTVVSIGYTYDGTTFSAPAE